MILSRGGLAYFWHQLFRCYSQGITVVLWKLNIKKFDIDCYQARRGVWLTSEAGTTNLVGQWPMSRGRQVPPMCTDLAIRGRWIWNMCRMLLEATIIVNTYLSLVRFKFWQWYCGIHFSVLDDVSTWYFLWTEQVSAQSCREGQVVYLAHHRATSRSMWGTKWRYCWMLRLWSKCRRVMEVGIHVWLRYGYSGYFADTI